MKINYYEFEDFKIDYLNKGWYCIKSKELGVYVYNIDSTELAKFPIESARIYTNNQIYKLISDKEVIPTHTYNPTDFFLSGKVPRLMIYPTSACNLSCIYCHCSSERESVHMTDSVIFESISKYIKFVESQGCLSNGIEITFMGGGEPFLKIGSIKKIVDYLKNNRISAKFSIVTNGTLGSDSDWLWLISEKFRITISADGPPHVQNHQRPYNSNNPTADIIERRLHFLSNQKVKINIRSTVINSSKKNIDDICKYFRLFKCISTHHLEPVSFAGRGESLSGSNISHFYSNFFKYYSKYLYSNPSRFKSSWFKPFQKSDGFCGAVYHNSIVTHDGYVTLCSEVDSKSINNKNINNFLVSKIEEINPFTSDKAIEFSQKNALDHLPVCCKCIIKYKCGGGCYVKRARDFYDNQLSFYDSFCKNVIALQISYLLQVYEKRNFK